MTWVADYSFARPDLAALKAAGASGIIRYAVGAGKALEAAEVAACKQLGLTLTVVQEGGNQPALRGFQGGVDDATAANRAMDAVGYTGWLYYVLEDPNRLPVAQWPTVVDYLNGVHSVKGRTVGGYGSRALLVHVAGMGLIVGRWPVEFWGGHGPEDHLSQYAANVPPAFNGQIDANLVIRADYGQHPRPTPPPPSSAANHSAGGNGMNIICQRPNALTAHQFAIGVDGQIWGVDYDGVLSDPWGNNSFIMDPNRKWAALGGDPLAGSLAGAWTNDGRFFRLSCVSRTPRADGTLKFMIREFYGDTGKWGDWLEMPNAATSPQFAMTPGPAGPPGPAGVAASVAAYDDSAIKADLAKVKAGLAQAAG